MGSASGGGIPGYTAEDQALRAEYDKNPNPNKGSFTDYVNRWTAAKKGKERPRLGVLTDAFRAADDRAARQGRPSGNPYEESWEQAILKSQFTMDPLAFKMKQGRTQWGQEQADAIRSKAIEDAHSYDQRSEIDKQRDAYRYERDRQMRDLLPLYNTALGRTSTARSMAEEQRRNLANQIVSQAASARGGFNPLLARSARGSVADLRQNMAAPTALAAEQERQAAEKALMSGLLGIGKQDVEQMGLESGMFGATAGAEKSGAMFDLGKEAAARGWTGLDLAQKQAGAAMMSQREADLLKMYMQQRAIDQGIDSMEVPSFGWGDIVRPILSGVAGAFAGPAGAIAAGTAYDGVSSLF